MRHLILRAAGTVLFCALAAANASAADLKVFSTIAVQGALEAMAPKYEKKSGNTLDITWGTAAALAKRIQAGETPDVMILTPPLLDTLIKEDKAAPGITPVASSGIAMVVKADAPKPDISTPDAFKQALLDAKSIAFSDPAAGGASGVYVAKLLDRLGIADAVKNKIKHPPAGGNAAVLVAKGEAELAIQQTPEVMAAQGIDIVGVLPGDLNNITMFAAGVGKMPKDKTAAESFVQFLKSPEAANAFKMRGLDPA
ncbi:MAG: molybdate ABC transporter substrate-binding protein [Bradyrhizobiaceae bacterium]|nr:MAG: molybdate ABC transporter substrate-binding protein [Bradyrhizobiaceae bacterium]